MLKGNDIEPLKEQGDVRKVKEAMGSSNDHVDGALGKKAKL